MEFKNQIPEWRNEGNEPSESLKNNGFSAGDKPPANVFNWFWHKVCSCINELQEVVSGKAKKDLSDVDDAVFKAKVEGSGATVTTDAELSTTSQNPIQNKAVTNALSKKANLKDGKVSVENGGTGANTPEGARSNLGVFAKNEVCNADTLGLFGLSADKTPNNILELFGGHWWRRREIKEDISISDALTTVYLGANKSNSTEVVYYSNEISIADNGNNSYIYTLVDPSTVQIGYTAYTNAETLRGKYFTAGTSYDNSDSTISSTRVWYADDNASYSCVMDGNYYSATIEAHAVSGEITYGDWEYVTSTRADAYPTGRSGEYYYEYLGVPFENARGGIRMESYTYWGTGTYSKDEPFTVTLDFEPKLVIIQVGGGDEKEVYADQWCAFTKYGVFGNDYDMKLYCSFEGKKLDYAFTTVNSQMNEIWKEYAITILG